LFSRQFPEADGDRGGNRFVVRATAGQSKLHALWDNLLGNAEPLKILGFLARKAQQQYPRKAAAKELQKKTFVEWAKDGFAVARDVAYSGGELRGASSDDAAAPVPALPAGYEANAREVARQRIAL